MSYSLFLSFFFFFWHDFESPFADLVPTSAVKTPGAAPVIESMGMADFPEFFASLEQSIEGMVERVSGDFAHDLGRTRTLTFHRCRSTTRPEKILRASSGLLTVLSCLGRL